MMKRYSVAVIVCVLWLSGCGVLPLGTPPPPAPSEASAGTSIAQTVEAVLTQTAAAVPTETTTPTAAPTVTITPTSTITLTPFLGAASGDLECKVLTQSVRNGVHREAREPFNVGWKVRNTGQLGWDAGTVYFAYFRGTKMDLDDVYYLPNTISPGNTVALSASMVAPKKPGGYTTVWALRRGQVRFCQVSLTIYVP